MKIFKIIIEIFLGLIGYVNNDPIKYCILHKQKNCFYINSIYCNFPNCQMLIDYELENENDV